VTNIDEIIGKLDGFEVLTPKRTTFYGATEYTVREPGGNAIGFAEMSNPNAG